MINTTYTVSDKQIDHQGKIITIKSAGIKDNRPYVELDPPDECVAEVITQHINRVIDGGLITISLDDIKNELSNSKSATEKG